MKSRSLLDEIYAAHPAADQRPDEEGTALSDDGFSGHIEKILRGTAQRKPMETPALAPAGEPVISMPADQGKFIEAIELLGKAAQAILAGNQSRPVNPDISALSGRLDRIERLLGELAARQENYLHADGRQAQARLPAHSEDAELEHLMEDLQAIQFRLSRALSRRR